MQTKKVSIFGTRYSGTHHDVVTHKVAFALSEPMKNISDRQRTLILDGYQITCELSAILHNLNPNPHNK